jgi:prepilin-type N-terminal cleavage/methylation domain-containing protein
MRDKRLGTRDEGRGAKTGGTRGFTLIETIITLVVLSIAIVGVLSVFTMGIKGSADPLIVNQAIQLAQGEMDQVSGEKSMNGFAAATLAIGNPPCNSTIPAGFTCSRTISFVDPGDLNAPVAGPTDYKYVTVTIIQVAMGSISLDTIISHY